MFLNTFCILQEFRFDYLAIYKKNRTSGDNVDAFFLPGDGGAWGSQGTTWQGHRVVQDHIQ